MPGAPGVHDGDVTYSSTSVRIMPTSAAPEATSATTNAVEWEKTTTLGSDQKDRLCDCISIHCAWKPWKPVRSLPSTRWPATSAMWTRSLRVESTKNTAPK